ncbi:Splicing factor U2AF 26 kDa subunit [Lobulomyces angularis]|nr:Splicing factor U2AF 26 kDa subunit [Lobulomyces angularis]
MASQYNEQQLQEHFDLFFEDLFIELAKFGEIEELNVCDNVGDHLVGNVYVRFRYEEDAQKAMESLNDRFYAGRPVYCELSPVTDFKESCCRQYDNDECTRGGFCNFMHLKKASKQLKRELFDSQKKYLKIKRREEEEARAKAEKENPSSRRSGRERGASRERGEERYSSRDRDFEGRERDYSKRRRYD